VEHISFRMNQQSSIDKCTRLHQSTADQCALVKAIAGVRKIDCVCGIQPVSSHCTLEGATQ
jgi:hypothetical protein